MSLRCPCCHSKVIWQFSTSERADYACQKCGHTWRKELEEQQWECGTFLGDWTPQEIDEIDKSVPAYQRRYKDWCFYKGRKIYTAWRKTAPEKFIFTRSLRGNSGLIWWVSCGMLNPNWYDYYQKASADRTRLAS